jgi:hypothetical protein
VVNPGDRRYVVQIKSDMMVADVIQRYPETIEVLLGRGCPDMRSGFFNLMARFMSIRNAARIHRIPLTPPLEDLNKTVAGSQRSHE